MTVRAGSAAPWRSRLSREPCLLCLGARGPASRRAASSHSARVTKQSQIPAGRPTFQPVYEGTNVQGLKYALLASKAYLLVPVAAFPVLLPTSALSPVALGASLLSAGILPFGMLWLFARGFVVRADARFPLPLAAPPPHLSRGPAPALRKVSPTLRIERFTTGLWPLVPKLEAHDVALTDLVFRPALLWSTFVHPVTQARFWMEEGQLKRAKGVGPWFSAVMSRPPNSTNGHS